jgi:hypothetical protein
MEEEEDGEEIPIGEGRTAWKMCLFFGGILGLSWRHSGV